jgi:uncharacterized protein (TIGR02246 family)
MPILRPEEVHPAFARAFNAADLDALAALYEPGAVLVPDPGQQICGTAAIREAFAGFLALKPRMELSTEAIVESPDGLALVHGRWTLSGAAPDGSQVRTQGRSAEVLRRQPDGAWLYVIDNPFAG